MTRTTLAGVEAPHPRTDGPYAELFAGHFSAMGRLAALLGADDPEDIAQEAFVRLHRRTATSPDRDAATRYLRATVVNLSRSRLRHRTVSWRRR